MEMNAPCVMVVDSTPSVSSVTVRSSEGELELMAAAVALQKRKELKEIELLEAENQRRLAEVRSARGSKTSSVRSREKLGRALVSGKTVHE